MMTFRIPASDIDTTGGECLARRLLAELGIAPGALFLPREEVMAMVWCAVQCGRSIGLGEVTRDLRALPVITDRALLDRLDVLVREAAAAARQYWADTVAETEAREKLVASEDVYAAKRAALFKAIDVAIGAAAGAEPAP